MSEPEIGGASPAINVEAGKSYWWCACGRSKSQPFCDGSHKGTIGPREFKPEATGEVWFCTCKRTEAAALRRQPQELRYMPDLLLEFFSEEIPARMQARAAEDLKKLVTDRLVAAGSSMRAPRRSRRRAGSR